MFCDTALFSQFINSVSIIQQDGSTKFFFECVKKGRDKNKSFLPNIIPKNIILAPQIKIDDLKGKDFFYATFPKLNQNLYIKYEVPTKPYKSKFLFQKDEWCYDYTKLKKKNGRNTFYISFMKFGTTFFFFNTFLRKRQNWHFDELCHILIRRFNK